MNIFRNRQKNKNIQPGPKKQHSYMKKECITKMGRFYPNGDHYSM